MLQRPRAGLDSAALLHEGVSSSTQAPSRFDPWVLLFVLAGLGNLVNGLGMIVAPGPWYRELPGSIPDFGPYNEHFIRDLGCMFSTWGAALIWAAVRPRARVTIVALLAAWYGAHALVHVYDTARGFVGPEHWVLDLPLCYAPALLMIGILVVLLRGGQRAE